LFNQTFQVDPSPHFCATKSFHTTVVQIVAQNLRNAIKILTRVSITMLQKSLQLKKPKKIKIYS